MASLSHHIIMNKNKKEDEPINRKATKQNNTPVAKNNEKKQPEEVKPKKPAKIKPIPFFFSILFIIYELASIILYLILLYRRSQFVKQEFYVPEFSRPDSTVKVLHFLFHSALIIFIVFLMIFAYKDIINKNSYIISLASVITGLLAFIFYSAYNGTYFVSIKLNKHVISLNDLREILNSTSPADFAFIYSKNLLKIHNCTTNPLTGLPSCTDHYLNCYSYNGVKFPLKSQLADEQYNISNPPPFFYLNIEQEVNASDEFNNQFNKISAQIKKCTPQKQKIKYYPLLNRTFAVTNPVMPPLATDKTRKIAGFLGAGADYDLYIKSVPAFKYKQRVNVELDSDFNYTRLWTKKSCSKYGRCSVMNKKPFPLDGF